MCLDESWSPDVGLGVVVLRVLEAVAQLTFVMWLDDGYWYDVRMVLALGQAW